MQAQLEQQAAEGQLKQQFSTKAFRPRTWKPTRHRWKEMEESLGALLRQLPSDTEVPGLLGDITRTGLGSGLEFEKSSCFEVAQQLHRAADPDPSVVGGYRPWRPSSAACPAYRGSSPCMTSRSAGRARQHVQLRMSILAKTYRYNDKG